MPDDWLKLTTHRLDIYNESLAKVEFTQEFENLYREGISDMESLSKLPTAYDYIRLGHPLSCILEWIIAKAGGVEERSVISFSSQTIAVLAVLRENALLGKRTKILYKGKMPESFDSQILKDIYQYEFELREISEVGEIKPFDGSQILLEHKNELCSFDLEARVDFIINTNDTVGSVIVINKDSENYISAIQHVRRRETIAMTPANCLAVLQNLVTNSHQFVNAIDVDLSDTIVRDNIKSITHTSTKPLVASSGLSMQYAIMMGLVDEATAVYPGKDIKFIVPPNCYGGTNDQARRVAAAIENVEVIDLPVDDGRDMVQSIEKILNELAEKDAVPYIVAEIPTNPRVEVPDLLALKNVLGKKRTKSNGEKAIEPTFILDQTFCPNVNFLGKGQTLAEIQAISYASGSKFPSGGRCTAGYCVVNDKGHALVDKIERHLKLCDNEATALQMEILAEQLPSMLDRIDGAYKNTRAFVNFISEELPSAKINFVSEQLASAGFTPSVFSLDLPTKGSTAEEKEAYKRSLNHKLISLMITEISDESKYCVSYGQLKGCYWTIPATSTQGTTKEGDKDYIARVSLSANMDLKKHKEVFTRFVREELL